MSSVNTVFRPELYSAPIIRAASIAQGKGHPKTVLPVELCIPGKQAGRHWARRVCFSGCFSGPLRCWCPFTQRPVHRASPGLAWPGCRLAGSPCSEVHSPATPGQSGHDRWTGSCRLRVERHTAAACGTLRIGSGARLWTRRTSAERLVWQPPWSQQLQVLSQAPLPGYFLVPLHTQEKYTN